MHRTLLIPLFALGFVSLSVSCDLKEPHIVLTIEDPDRLASDAEELLFGDTTSSGDQTPIANWFSRPLKNNSFPTTITLSRQSKHIDGYLLWVEALDNHQNIIARGFAKLDVDPEAETTYITLELMHYCGTFNNDENPDPSCSRCYKQDGNKGVCSNNGERGVNSFECDSPRCGDGVEPAFNCNHDREEYNAPKEECDDGNNSNFDNCTNDCKVNVCGDGVINRTQEECDDGESNSDNTPNSCRTDCTLPRCGDEVIDLFEDCDDGNTADEDTCLNSCQFNLCGDGILNNNAESCDHGIKNGQGPGDCLSDCSGTQKCGDGAANGTETCDDGNTNPNDACHQCQPVTWTSDVLLGPNVAAAEKNLRRVTDMETNLDGTLYIVDSQANQVFKITNPTSDHPLLTLVAGTGSMNTGSPETPRSAGGQHPLLALNVPLNHPTRIAVDGFGNVFILEKPSNKSDRVRRIDSSGFITTVVGDEASCEDQPECEGPSSDESAFDFTEDITIDGLGNLYLGLGSNKTGIVMIPLANPQSDKEYIRGNCKTYPFQSFDELSSVPGDCSDEFYADSLAFGSSGEDGDRIYFTNRESNQVYAVNTGTLETPSAVEAIAGDGNTCTFASSDAQACSSEMGKDALLVSLAAPGSLTRTLDGDLVLVVQSILKRRPDGSSSLLQNSVVRLKERADKSWAVDLVQGPYVWQSSGKHTIAAISNRVFLEYNYGETVARLLPDNSIEGLTSSESDSCRTTIANHTEIYEPHQMAKDSEDNLYLVLTENSLVVKYNPETGDLIEVAGTGEHCSIKPESESCGDGSFNKAPVAFNQPEGIAIDPINDDLYVADTGNNRIRKIPLSKNPESFCKHDIAKLNITSLLPTLGSKPTHLEFSPNGDLYFSGSATGGGYNVYRILQEELTSDPATSEALFEADFSLSSPPGLGFDSAQNLYLAVPSQESNPDDTAGRIYRITFDENGSPSSPVQIAGTGAPCQDEHCGDGGAALEGQFQNPRDLDIDASGVIYIADRSTLRTLTPTEGATTYTLDTIAGHRDNTAPSTIGDGGPQKDATFSNLVSVLIPETSSPRKFYIADDGTDLVRTLDTENDQIITAIGVDLWPQDCNVTDERCEPGFSQPSFMAPLPLENNDTLWLVSDGRTNRLRAALLKDGHLTQTETVAGSGPQLSTPWCDKDAGSDSSNSCNLYPDPPEHTPTRYSRLLQNPTGVASDPDTGAVYVVEQTRESGEHGPGPLIHCLTYSLSSPTEKSISVFAGAGEGSGFIEGPRKQVRFDRPSGLAHYRNDTESFLYISDTGNQVVRRIQLDPTEPCQPVSESAEFTVVAGKPRQAGFVEQEGRLATESYLYNPSGIALDSNGYLFIADTGNHRVRRVSPEGIISTVLGTGTDTSLGEGAPANTLPVAHPQSLALDSYGNLYVTSGDSVRMVLASHSSLASEKEPDTAGGHDAVRTLYTSMGINSLSQETTCLSALAVDNQPDATEVHVMDECNGVWFVLKPNTEGLPH